MKHAAEELKALPGGSILGALGDSERAELAAIARRRRLAAGETVFAQGDPGDAMLVVLKGLLRIHILTASGREVVLDYAGPGQAIGEIAVLDGGPRAAGVTAVEASEVMMLTRRDLLPFLARHHDVALRVIGVLCARLRRTNDLVEASSTALGIGPRLARGLLRLAGIAADGDGDAGPHPLKITQGELAAHVGLARENVNRQLREWEEAGLLELGRGRLSLRDAAALAEIAEESD